MSLLKECKKREREVAQFVDRVMDNDYHNFVDWIHSGNIFDMVLSELQMAESQINTLLKFLEHLSEGFSIPRKKEFNAITGGIEAALRKSQGGALLLRHAKEKYLEVRLEQERRNKEMLEAKKRSAETRRERNKEAGARFRLARRLSADYEGDD